jgi:hypothetical protein
MMRSLSPVCRSHLQLITAQATAKEAQRRGSRAKFFSILSASMKTNAEWLWLSAKTATLLLAAGLTGCQHAETKPPLAAAEFERQGSLSVVPEQSSLWSRLVFETVRKKSIPILF